MRTALLASNPHSNLFHILHTREFPSYPWLMHSHLGLRYTPMTFDPNFPMIPGMRYPPPIPGPTPPVLISPDEGLEVDEHGNVNWRLAWLKEIGHLQQITAEQEKASVDPEWYRMMLIRVRTALMPPPHMNPEMMHAAMGAPHLQPPQPTAQDLQQAQQQQQQQQQQQAQ